MAFEDCLFEVCTKSGWVLHAFVIMRNHYHLALETPGGNLVAGMQWLQATFANRFNKLRGEHGHLFQGRYKALLVEEGEPLGMVCHYLHLNPVRAGVVPVTRLTTYRYSSYWYLRQSKIRPSCLRLETCLTEAGCLSDSPAGWSSYDDHLAWQLAEGPAGKSKTYVSMSKGWVLGSAGFKRTLMQDHTLSALSRAWESRGAQEIREQAWEALFQQALKALGKQEGELRVGLKSAPWKVAVAAYLKERTQTSNPWLAQRLCMQRPVYVSRLVSAARRSTELLPELQMLRDKCKA